jgi:outer membrane protein insertion porin family
LLVVGAILSLFSWNTAPAVAQEGRTVDEIVVEGQRRVEPEAILRNVRQRVGEPLSYDQISRDIRAIYTLGFFEDIKVDAAEKDGKLVVAFVVTEKPSIARIRFEGNDELDTDEIKEVVNLRPFSVLDTSMLKSNEEKIVELYAEKGYFLTDVTSRVVPREDNKGEVEVIFEVDEHAKVQVRTITFLGNNSIKDPELAGIMETREGGLFSFLTESGTFKEQSFGMDMERLTAYYYDKGFINVKVSQPQLRLSRDKRYLFITVPISEGPQHTVKSVEVTGDFIVKKETLEALVQFQPEDIFSYSTLRSDITRIKDLYQDEGYANVNVNPIPQIDPNTHEVSLKYDIQKGRKVYFGRIEVVGNTKTRDKVVRRELLLSEGDLFSSTKIKRSKARVQRLGFFETVDITTHQSKERDTIDVRISVAERPTGTFQVGAGFSSVENFIAMAQISQNNLFGRGQSLSLQATLSSIRTLFNIRFSEPYLLDSKWQFSFDIFDFEFIFNDFTRGSTGGNITLGYPLPDAFVEDFLHLWGDMSLSTSYKLESVDVELGGRSGSSNRQVSGLFEGGLTSSMRFSLFWDSRDNRLFPTKGFLQQASVEVADDTILSENEFARYTLDSRWYFPIVWDFVLKFNGEVGLVQSTNPSKEVPIFERFFLGGPNSVRGFERSSLGPARLVGANPSDPGSLLTDFNIGGKKKLVLNTEIEFPIFTAVGIKGVFFFDMGNAFDDGESFSFVPDIFADTDNLFNDALRTSVGFGFRWFSPIGPLRFEWGFPLRRLAGEDPLVFEFSIGNAF